MTVVFLAFCAGLVATACTIRVARRFHFVNRPRHDRWNKREVALHGGIGVGCAFFATAMWAGHLALETGEYLLIALSAVMLVTGFLDDIFGLMPLPKLVTEITVALVAVCSGSAFSISGNMVFDGLITAFWIVGIINSVNMLDNIDGATAGVLVISLAGMLLVFGGAPEGGTFVVEALCGVLAGFLLFNFNPARIFLGDSGSLFLGCLASLLAVRFGSVPSAQAISDTAPQSFALIVLVFAVFILDTSFVVLNRKLNGYPAMNGDRGHIAHRLAAVYRSDRKAVLTLYLYQAVIIALAYRQLYAWLVPMAVGTLYGLYQLTVRTNHLVWPDKYPAKPASAPDLQHL